MTAQPPEGWVEAVQTGYPLVHLIACKRCGVLLWDYEAHYRHAHPEALA